MDTIIVIFLLLGFICFVIAAIGVTWNKVNLIALGLAFWIATLLLPHLK